MQHQQPIVAPVAKEKSEEKDTESEMAEQRKTDAASLELRFTAALLKKTYSAQPSTKEDGMAAEMGDKNFWKMKSVLTKLETRICTLSIWIQSVLS